MEIPEGLEHQKIFFEIGEKLINKVAQKNSDYGDAFEKIVEIFKVLFPNGIPVNKYYEATLLIRLMDKICRITNEKDKFYNEDSWDDLAGYAMIYKVFREKSK